MLKGISPLLTPHLLKVLAEMGHGDELVLADANFTAAALAREAGCAVLQVPGATVEQLARAVLALMPLDEAVEQPVAYMQVCAWPQGQQSAQQRAVIAMLAREGHASAAQCAATERFAFYERTRRAFAIVLTGELQPYGNFILKKGVIGEALVP
jgi:L-fucose mutarotase